ncbi:RHS repeat domain-containing protein [Chitinimonas koreensis]|uniref:RHS repeat domain-containing protein n=1 Tax=Chitinimonas koreensis TaxID=356302 RepID=UPI0004098FE7|nr:RHS repeat-associated core domain-containing protein [Chitinimonas koreensis]QNM95496.1 RHS repeat protein [Chitinimonas koreensis]
MSFPIRFHLTHRAVVCRAALAPLLLAAAIPAGAAETERVQYEYDAFGQVTARIDGTGQRTAYTYDANGKLSGETDPLQRTTSYAYDALGRLNKVTDAAKGSTRYAYDGRDNLTKVTDPRSLATEYQYDGLDRQIKLTSPDTGVTSWVPRPDGQSQSRTDNLKQTTQYQYDAAGRLIKVTYADGQTEIYAYGASASGTSAGKPTLVIDGTGQVAYGYDAAGRRSIDNRTLRGRNYVVRYAWDAKGNHKLTYPSGRAVNYLLDANGHLSRIETQIGTAAAVPLATAFVQRPFGPVAGWTFGNGEVRSSSYDLAGRMSKLTLGDSTVTLSYDQAGRLTGQQIAGGWWDRLLQRLGLPAGQRSSYGYDALDRLTSWQGEGQNRAYGYDAGGNRTSLTADGQAYTLTVDKASNRLTGSVGPQATAYQYDANGSRVTDSRQSYRYDARGRLVSAGGAEYAVDARGRRLAKTWQGVTTLYHYDQWGRLLAETDTQGTTRREYVYLGRQPIAVIDFGTEIRYVHTDHLGTPRLVTDAAKQPIWAWQGEPFGAMVPNEDPSGTNAPYAFNLRFPGQYYDRETGLHYNYFRDYDPQTGRYIQSDPIGLAGGINTYAYVNGNPLSHADSQGLFVDTTGAYTGISVSAGAATGTSAAVAGAGIGAAALGGVGIGLGFNWAWEKIAGQPLGGSIYDLFHPEPSSQLPGGNATTQAPYTHLQEEEARNVKPDVFACAAGGNGKKNHCGEIANAIAVLKSQISWRKTDLNPESPSYMSHKAWIDKTLNPKLAELERFYRDACQ